MSRTFVAQYQPEHELLVPTESRTRVRPCTVSTSLKLSTASKPRFSCVCRLSCKFALKLGIAYTTYRIYVGRLGVVNTVRESTLRCGFSVVSLGLRPQVTWCVGVNDVRDATVAGGTAILRQDCGRTALSRLSDRSVATLKRVLLVPSPGHPWPHIKVVNWNLPPELCL